MSDKNINQKINISFSSFSNDRGLSLNDKTKDYVDRNTVGLKINFYKNTTPQLLEHIGLQNMKVGVKANFGWLAAVCLMHTEISS